MLIALILVALSVQGGLGADLPCDSGSVNTTCRIVSHHVLDCGPEAVCLFVAGAVRFSGQGGLTCVDFLCQLVFKVTSFDMDGSGAVQVRALFPQRARRQPITDHAA